MIVTIDEDYISRIQKYLQINHPDFEVQVMTQEQARERFPLFKEKEWIPKTRCTFVPVAGWAENGEALKAFTQQVLDSGVKYRVATVERLVFSEDEKTVTDVKTTDGEVITADKTLLCTGAYTAKLLADSAPKRTEMQIGHRIVAAGAAMAKYRIPRESVERWRGVPITCTIASEYPAEALPPKIVDEDGWMKVVHERSFSNHVWHEASGQMISVPPQRESHRMWTEEGVPEGFQRELDGCMKGVFPEMWEELRPVEYRLCWLVTSPVSSVPSINPMLLVFYAPSIFVFLCSSYF